MSDLTWTPNPTESGIWSGDTIPLVADGHLFGALVTLCDDEHGVQADVRVDTDVLTVGQMVALSDALRAVAAARTPQG